jgi:predicted metal-dependent hydrolase
MPGLSNKGDAEGMIQLGVGDHDSLERNVAHGGRSRAVEASELLADIGRRIQQEPVMAVGADRGR